ncbi:unnamed protein product [Eruca vesicaria subsp. sativa]|uniref:Uncharacterized protein n=1 Tax=Eruca vesicaria subsp. sativa TaxID=29727 RepID=A0ABC8L0P2_ERUVS|nr:unnamed protein product [Eruca vesicaria subsp. sativa]
MFLNVRTWLEEIALLVTVDPKFSLEMAYAYNFLANQDCNTPPFREIIELENNDDEVMVHETLKNVVRVGAGDIVPDYISQADAPPVFWDVGMDLMNYTTHGNNRGPAGEAIQNGMRFWEEVANEGGCENQKTNEGITNTVRDDESGGSSTWLTNTNLVPNGVRIQVPMNEMVEEQRVDLLDDSEFVLQKIQWYMLIKIYE